MQGRGRLSVSLLKVDGPTKRWWKREKKTLNLKLEFIHLLNSRDECLSKGKYSKLLNVTVKIDIQSMCLAGI